MAELAVVERSGFVESRHFGTLSALTADGSVAVSLGDPTATILPRSTTKPWQAVGCRAAGLALSTAGTALSAGSHTGEDRHVAVVHEILADAGLSEKDLRCVPDWPEDEATRHRLIRAGEGPSQVRMNCSGKHAAMLATARLRGWSTPDYLDRHHPLQRAIAATVEDLAGEKIAHTAVDGCGTPLFAISLQALTRAVGRIAAASPGAPEGLVAEAIRTHPEMVAGNRRDNTALMRAVPGLIAKDGFEAVQVAALPDGTAIGIKIADGSDRARMPVTAAALVLAGIDSDLLAPFTAEARVNGLTVVGLDCLERV